MNLGNAFNSEYFHRGIISRGYGQFSGENKFLNLNDLEK